MSFVAEVARWFSDPEHWRGITGVPHRLVQDVQLCALAILIACAIALPIGIALGHLRRGGVAVVGVANIGRALPSFGIVAIALPISLRLGLGLGFWPTLVALVALALPPIVTTAYTALREVDPDALEAAAGMGLRGREVLLSVELPLASPVLFAAIRVSAVQVVATAPLGALVGWGGLGRYIVDGFAQRDLARAAAGALLVASLAIFTDLTFGYAERVLLPRGVRRLGRAEAPLVVAHRPSGVA